MDKPLSIALPKGRLLPAIIRHLAERGISINFDQHKLSTRDSGGFLEAYKVKNQDLPTYVHHGITGLGIAGDDSVAESGSSFVRVLTLPFGATSLCLAAGPQTASPADAAHTVSVATSYVHMTRAWFQEQGIPVKIIHLKGSVELAPALGLAPYIVDLTETGTTLKAHDLEVLTEIKAIKIRLIANPAYFKLHYRKINKLADILQ